MVLQYSVALKIDFFDKKGGPSVESFLLWLGTMVKRKTYS